MKLLYVNAYLIFGGVFLEVELPAVVFREGRFYVAFCPVNSVASQGKNVEEALKNLKEALELYYEDEEC